MQVKKPQLRRMSQESSSESKSSSEGDVDDEDAGEESLQTSPPTSQESEEPLESILAGAEPAMGETKNTAWKELKTAGDTDTEHMEVATEEEVKSIE